MSQLACQGQPDLTGRTARCSCGRTEPSSPKLPFFVYRGPGSEQATRSCKNCGYYDTAHTPEVMANNKGLKCTNFEARGDWGTDSYYCGHSGWS